MSDWWAKKLNSPAPAQQPRPNTPPVPQAAPRPTTVPPQYLPQGAVQQAPVQQVPAQQWAEEVDPDVEVPLGELLRTKTYAPGEIPTQAKALRQTGGTCPECGSGNFLKTERHEHCHDCGYPIVQAGSGMGALGGTGIVVTGGTHMAESPVYTQQLGG